MNTEKQAFQMQSVRTVFLFHLLQGCFFFIRYTRAASNRHQQCIAKLERLGRVKWRQKTLSVLIWRRVRQSAGSCSDRLISAEKAFFFIGLFSHSASQMGPTRDKTIWISAMWTIFLFYPSYFLAFLLLHILIVVLFDLIKHFKTCAYPKY